MFSAGDKRKGRIVFAVIGLFVLALVLLELAGVFAKSVPVKSLGGSYCTVVGDYHVLREDWQNIGKRPIRTVCMDVTAYNKEGRIVYQLRNHPIYAVSNNEPGIAPGEIFRPTPEQGVVIPISIHSPNAPAKVTGRITVAVEEEIRKQPKTRHDSLRAPVSRDQ